MTTTLDKFDPKRLSITEFQTKEKSKGQQTAYVKYNHPTLGENSTLLLQTEWITIDSGGVERPNSDFYANDKARAFMKLPLQEGTELFTKMQKLEKMLMSDAFKVEKLGGSKGKRYTMYPIVKIPEIDEESDRDPYPPSMKVKFDLHYDEDDPDACKIRTQVYKSIEKDGKRTRELTNATTLQDMEELIRLGSQVRIIMRPVKMWASGQKKYGIIWKAMKLEVIPSTRGNALMKSFYDNEGFLDSDDEDDQVKADDKEDDKDSDSESDDDDDQVKADDKDDVKDSDSESEKDDDDDDDEESPDIPAKPVRTKKTGKKSKNI